MPDSERRNFLSQNKCHMRINTAEHLAFRLVLHDCWAPCLDARQPCKTNLKPRCPAVLIRMCKYIFFAFGWQIHSDSARSAFVCVCVVWINISHTEYALHRSRTFGKIFVFYTILIFHMILQDSRLIRNS